MAAEHHENIKPSDKTQFMLTVWTASATVMDYETYCIVYEDLLQILFWNYDIDTPLAIKKDVRP